MPEHDLKLICEAIPVSSAGDVSTQAHSILLGLTGDDVEYNIVTGEQPQLFAPTITQSSYTLVGTNSPDNGAFPVTYTYYVDGVERADGTLTVADNGSSAYVKISSPNFKSAHSASITVRFATGPGIYVDATPLPTYALNQGYYLVIALIGESSPIFVTSNTSYYGNIDFSVDGGVTWMNAYANGSQGVTRGAPYMVLDANQQTPYSINGEIRVKVGYIGNNRITFYVTKYNMPNVFYVQGTLNPDIQLGKWYGVTNVSSGTNLESAIKSAAFSQITGGFRGYNTWYWPNRDPGNSTNNTMMVEVYNYTRQRLADGVGVAVDDKTYWFNNGSYGAGDQFTITFKPKPVSQ